MTINERVSDERLNTIKSWRETYGQDANVMIPASEAESIISELQQYRAAAEKPIGSFHIIDQQVDGTTDYVKDGEWPIDNGELLVYAAPQVTSVPTFDDLRDAVAEMTGGIPYQWPNSDKGHQPVPFMNFNSLGRIVDKFSAAPAVQAEQLSGSTEQVEPVTDTNRLPFERWLSQLTGKIDVDCGCVTTEAFFHWLRVAYDAGDSPVIPDGYALVPVEPTKEMMLHKSGCQRHAWDDADCPMRQTRRLVWGRMIEAAPKQDFREIPNSSTNNCRENAETSTKCWIPVSERMPGSRHAVLVGCWFGSEWTSKWATYVPGHPDAQDSGWLIPGASWTPTHWHELPAAPKQEAE